MTARARRTTFTRPRSAAALLLLLLHLAAAPELIAGRGDKVGAASGMQLTIPVGARSIALGGAALSSIGGVEAIAWNPAGLVRADRSAELFVSHMTYFADIGVEYVAGAIRLPGSASLGLSIRALSVGEIPVTTELQPDGTGEMASPVFLTAGAAFARKMSDQIAVGVTMYYVYERMADVSASGLSFTGGVQYSRLGGVDGLSVGVVISNIGPNLVYDGEGLERTAIVPNADRTETNYKVLAAAGSLPSAIEVGLGYLYPAGETIDATFSALFRSNNFSDDQYKFGAEFSYDRRFFLRAGYEYSTEAQGNESIFGPAFGVGVVESLKNTLIRVDYAYRSAEYFGGNHVVSLTVGF
jgi:hypothetical protein